MKTNILFITKTQEINDDKQQKTTTIHDNKKLKNIFKLPSLELRHTIKLCHRILRVNASQTPFYMH